MRHRPLAIAFAAACLSLPGGPVLADDDDRGGRSKGRDAVREFRDGPCKVKQEWKKNGDYKEERECKGLRGDGGGRRGVDAKEEFRDGPCRIRREWKKDGEYKEERECQGRGGDRSYRQPTAYPPWIVVQPDRPVYRPGTEPRPVPGTIRCNSEQVGQVLGGALGALLGNQVGEGSGRAIATVGGAVIGALIGGEIGRSIDQADQACIGQALEYGAQGQQIGWTSAAGTQYRVVPGAMYREGGRDCRRFEARVMTPRGWQAAPGRACRRADGVWVTA